MSGVSVSIDVSRCAEAVNFYVEALDGSLVRQYNEAWQVVSIGGLDIHIQEKAEGSPGAGGESRRYARHWTPVHLDFGVTDVREASQKVLDLGGLVESQSFSEVADIAVCADPFGNGFCLIRE